MYIFWGLVAVILIVGFLVFDGLQMFAKTTSDISNASREATKAYQECVAQAGRPFSYDEQVRTAQDCGSRMKEAYNKIEDPKLRHTMVAFTELVASHAECLMRGWRTEQLAFEDAIRNGIEPVDPSPRIKQAQEACNAEYLKAIGDLKRSLEAD